MVCPFVCVLMGVFKAPFFVFRLSLFLLFLSLSLPAVVEIVDAIDASNGFGRKDGNVVILVVVDRCCRCSVVVVVHADTTVTHVDPITNSNKNNNDVI